MWNGRRRTYAASSQPRAVSRSSSRSRKKLPCVPQRILVLGVKEDHAAILVSAQMRLDLEELLGCFVRVIDAFDLRLAPTGEVEDDEIVAHSAALFLGFE